MTLSDEQIHVFVSRVLHLEPGKRKEYLDQVDYLIDGLKKKIDEDSSFGVSGFKKTGSLMKGTVLKPRGENGVDADVAAYLDLSEAEKDDIEKLHTIIRDLLIAVYPTKKRGDFKVQPRTLGIHFRASGLDVDLVPIIPIPGAPGYGWQPSSQNGKPVKTSIQGQLDFIKCRKDADPRFKTIVRLLKHWRNEKDSKSFGHLLSSLSSRTSMTATVRRFRSNPGCSVFFFTSLSRELTERITFPELGKITSFPSDPVVVLDPVNKSNNVTARLTDEERKEVVSVAQTAWETISAASWKSAKGETLDLWKEIMGRSFTIDKE